MSQHMALRLWSCTCTLTEVSNPLCIVFASRTLWSSYAQIEKEALARCMEYVSSTSICMDDISNHRPLTTILSPKRGIPPLAAARLQRWAIIMSASWYDIEFRCTQDQGNADVVFPEYCFQPWERATLQVKQKFLLSHKSHPSLLLRVSLNKLHGKTPYWAK